MRVPIGVTNRHIHMTEEDYKYLFGEDAELKIYKEISQTGQFASFDKVTIKTEKRSIENVRVVGPFRNYTQVEISKTDAIGLGLNPPIRRSGDLKDSESLTICYKDKELYKENCCIIPDRHLHLSPKDSFKLGLYNNQVVKVKIEGEKGGILDNVVIRSGELDVMDLHIDTDDANGHLVQTGDKAEVIVDE